MNTLPIPDEIIERLRQLQGDAESHQWRVGDFLVEIVDELEGVYSQAGVHHARAWMFRHMANRIGADAGTLRDRECVARFYPEAVRQEYPFSYSQFRALKSAGDRWREYADWAAENLPAPCALIRAKIKNNGHLENTPAWKHKWDRAMELIQDVSQDAEAIPAYRRLASWFIIVADDKLKDYENG